MTRYDPYQHAEQLGITVLHRAIKTANGLWIPEHRVIVIRAGIRAVHDRAALAHEIGHAVHGHQDDRPKHEGQADLYAARKLIDPLKLKEVRRWVPDLPSLADELDVTPRLLASYLAAQQTPAA